WTSVDAGSASTVAVEAAVADPAPFEAVTTTRSSRPKSVSLGVYVADVAPAMAAQVPPSEDDCHWKSKLGVSPCQLPLPAVSGSSLDASPLIEGAMRLTGAAASGPEPDSGTDPVREGVVGVADAGADVVGLGVLGCFGFGVFGGTTVRARIR